MHSYIDTLPDYISPVLDDEHIKEYFIDPYLSLVAGALSKKQQDSVHRVTNSLWVNLYNTAQYLSIFTPSLRHKNKTPTILAGSCLITYALKPSVVAYAYEDPQPSTAPYDDR